MLTKKLQDDIQSSNRKEKQILTCILTHMTIKYTKPKTMLKWGTCWKYLYKKN
jgi:hypothetical protein